MIFVNNQIILCVKITFVASEMKPIDVLVPAQGLGNILALFEVKIIIGKVKMHQRFIGDNKIAQLVHAALS